MNYQTNKNLRGCPTWVAQKTMASDRTGPAPCIAPLRACFGLTGLLLFQEPPVLDDDDDDDGWDRLVPPRILLWALDGEVRTWAPTELMERAVLRNGAAWHAAYGNVATLHYAHALVSQQRTIEAGRFRGLPAEESDSNCDVPPGWSPRVRFFLGGGTNTSSAKRVVIGSATVFMPVAPDLKFRLRDAPRCARNAHAHRVRVPMRPCKSAR
jgi:hypothetical protein